jgi:hypothetical protein
MGVFSLDRALVQDYAAFARSLTGIKAEEPYRGLRPRIDQREKSPFLFWELQIGHSQQRLRLLCFSVCGIAFRCRTPE